MPKALIVKQCVVSVTCTAAVEAMQTYIQAGIVVLETKVR